MIWVMGVNVLVGVTVKLKLELILSFEKNKILKIFHICNSISYVIAILEFRVWRLARN